MADISEEVSQLRNAVYGEEVRGAFISCMEKILSLIHISEPTRH